MRPPQGLPLRRSGWLFWHATGVHYLNSLCMLTPFAYCSCTLQVPSTTQPPEGYDIHAEIKLEVPVEHGLLIENLLDLAHAPFTHQG